MRLVVLSILALTALFFAVYCFVAFIAGASLLTLSITLFLMGSFLALLADKEEERIRKIKERQYRSHNC